MGFNVQGVVKAYVAKNSCTQFDITFHISFLYMQKRSPLDRKVCPVIARTWCTSQEEKTQRKSERERERESILVHKNRRPRVHELEYYLYIYIHL